MTVKSKLEEIKNEIGMTFQQYREAVLRRLAREHFTKMCRFMGYLESEEIDIIIEEFSKKKGSA